MPKSVLPNQFDIAGRSFTTNAVPDPFDERDFQYRPRLEPLKPRIAPPPRSARHVMTQEGNSCTGHALASAINAALAKAGSGRSRSRVSPRMLYHFALRYDEFPGERDEGSSLRAALRGWFYHGVCLETKWPPGDVNEPEFVRHCRERPCGAFYRVNCFRLDDMQSAISELHAVVASAQIHEGWKDPEPCTNEEGDRIHLIQRPAAPTEASGHAFAIVGYNELGFVVQNSWGPDWGDGGFAVLTYEDWLDSAYDAWVVRHGVPHTPFVTGRRRDEEATNSILATGVGPDRRRLDRHVIRLGGDGGLAETGEFISTQEQLDRILSRMGEWHEGWAKQPAGASAGRHVVLYVPSGIMPESATLETAQRQLNWWMNNRIYPIYLAWDGGPAQDLLHDLGDRMERRLPEGGIGFDLVEQFDRLVEMTARRHCRWLWEQLKRNARAGAALEGLAELLGRYAAERGEELKLHLAAHGTGAILAASLLGELSRRGVRVGSIVLLAPAIRVDEFDRALAGLPDGSLERLVLFGLSRKRELDDTCAAGDTHFYQKSLLYLIARGLESHHADEAKTGEVPLLGMAKYFEDPALQARLRRKCVEAEKAEFITAPSAAPKNSRTDAVGHGDLENDGFTLTSVAMRLLESPEVEPFRANTPLLGLTHVPGQKSPEAKPAGVADTQPPASPPVSTTAEASPVLPRVPRCRNGETPPEIGEASEDGLRTTPTRKMAGYWPLREDHHIPHRGGEPWPRPANGRQSPTSAGRVPSPSE